MILCLHHAWTFCDAGTWKRVCNQSKSSHAQRRIDRFVCELDIKGLVTKLIAGLAAMAIGLGKETSNHTAELITPILTCLTGLLMRWTTVANMMLDSHHRCRQQSPILCLRVSLQCGQGNHSAIASTKIATGFVEVSREAVLPLFNEMFSAISCVVADPDQNVKNGSELLDRLLKDIVTESKAFDVESFVPALRERMYTRDRWVCQI